MFDHYRRRTTGPCFPLAVLRCKTHGRGFTLYPPGHVPYGRRAIAPVAPDGSPVTIEQAGVEEGRQQPDDEQEQAALSPAALAFRGTVFDAALDAAAGCIWQRGHLPGGSERWWSSQGRWIDRALRLLGLAPDQSVSLRHEIAELLLVDTLRLQELSSQLGGTVGYRRRGLAICQVLAALPVRSAFLAERLQNCGQRSGLWACPLRWDRESLALHAEPYRLTDTRAPP